MVNSGLCRGDSPSLRNTRPISKTFSKPPTTSRLRYSSGAMRRYRSMSRALWWVTNGRAAAPPGIGWKTGVSTSTKPRSSSQRRIRETIRLRSEQGRAGPLVGPQVDVALAVAQVDVGDAPPLVAEAARGPRPAAPTTPTLTDSSPVRVRDHLAGRRRSSRRATASLKLVEVLGPLGARRTAGSTPDESRSWPKASLPCSRRSISRPATATAVRRPVSARRRSSGRTVRRSAQHRRRWRSALEAVGDVGLDGPAAPGASTRRPASQAARSTSGRLRS